MSVIKFIYDSTIQNCPLLKISSHVIQITLETPVIQEVLEGGFYIMNEHNGKVMGDYSKYTTIYDSFEDNQLQFLLSDDGSVKPTAAGYNITFVAGDGGSLQGETTQNVINYNELTIPTPIANENYKFTTWTPEIPLIGELSRNEEFVATFQYVPTLDDVKNEKIKIIEEIYNKNFIDNGTTAILSDGTSVSITNIDMNFQMILADAYNNAVTMKSANMTDVIPFDINGVCHSYSPDDIIRIYIAEQSFVIYNRSLKNELIATINRCTNKQAVSAIEYEVESLDDIALNNFQKSISDGTTVIENLVKLYHLEFPTIEDN